ncbi:hypothetical protein NH340_JMT08331 [Sarcoptes scabiei]|nr:hypothetical protein NH340_JMT08331 [Sarcoptes scabiei]
MKYFREFFYLKYFIGPLFELAYRDGSDDFDEFSLVMVMMVMVVVVVVMKLKKVLIFNFLIFFSTSFNN